MLKIAIPHNSLQVGLNMYCAKRMQTNFRAFRNFSMKYNKILCELCQIFKTSSVSVQTKIRTTLRKDVRIFKQNITENTEISMTAYQMFA